MWYSGIIFGKTVAKSSDFTVKMLFFKVEY